MDKKYYKKLEIREGVYQLENGVNAKFAVFLYPGPYDPHDVLKSAIEEYVGDEGYHEFVDSSLSNPWMKVVVSDINEMNSEPFDPEYHHISIIGPNEPVPKSNAVSMQTHKKALKRIAELEQILADIKSLIK